MGYWTTGDVLTATKLNNVSNRVKAAETAQHSHNSPISTAATSYTKIKTITFNVAITGSFRVSISGSSSPSVDNHYLRVYKNGVAIGTPLNWVGSAAASLSEDFTLDLAINDTIEVWGYTTNASYPTYSNTFEIRYVLDQGITVTNS